MPTGATFSGGAKLEAKLKGLTAKLSKGLNLRVGFLEGATYPDGTKVATVAAIQEFGAPGAHIPPRLPFRKMIAEKSPRWGALLEAALKATDYDLEKALGICGIRIGQQLQAAIQAVNSPPLSAVTVMLRSMKSRDQGLVVTQRTVWEAIRRVQEGETPPGAVNTKPLDETSHMINSVDHEVVSA